MLKPTQETKISKGRVGQYIFSYTLLFENINFPIMVKYPSPLSHGIVSCAITVNLLYRSI